MKVIKVKILDHLSPSEEVKAIASQLAQKQLSGHGFDKSRLLEGDNLKITEKGFRIEVERYSREKPIELVTCNVCGCDYQNNMAKHYYTNYGGSIKKKSACSTDCVNVVVGLFSGRVALKKSQLKRIRLYN